MDKTTFSLWNEPKHNNLGLSVTEMNGFRRYAALGLFLGLKSKILLEQNVSIFPFYIHLPNFRLLGSIIKKYLKLADASYKFSMISVFYLK